MIQGKKNKYKNTALHFSFCHQLPERSYFYKGKQLPLCARCTGIYLGYTIFPLFLFDIITLSLFWSLLLVIPTYIDGAIQAYFNVESTNSRRLITGILSGVGTMSLISIFGIYIGNQILTLIN